MAETLKYTSEVLIEVCINCGCPVALTSEHRTALQGNHQWFYCPNGHAMHWPAESDKDRVKRLENELRQIKRIADNNSEWGNRMADERNAEKRSHAATKGTLTKTRKRILAGVCPHCKRTFQNVARHMKSKHEAVPA